MKASLGVLLFVASWSALAAAQNPYPTGCNAFVTETVTCSDVDVGQGSCHGSLADVIITPTGGSGTSYGQFATLVCTGGTNQCSNGSPTCPTCPNVSNYVQAQTNPACVAPTCTGSPGFACSGSITCTDGTWGCTGTECALPPPSNVCNNGEYGTVTCGGAGWYCFLQDSPIIIDTNGTGFQLTSAANGVMFDIKGNGVPLQIAWTAPGSRNSWLALDRNHNGKIDSGKELFGNFTEQPPSTNPNGYLALAEFDKPENGGNGDGMIDSRDAVFPKLLLWIDESHDGISQPNELHSLSELGVFSISLHYQSEPFKDQYGNSFHYRAKLNPDPADGESRDGRWTYDVFLDVLNGKASQTKGSIEGIVSAVDHSLH
jgi:hypothetical protein